MRDIKALGDGGVGMWICILSLVRSEAGVVIFAGLDAYFGVEVWRFETRELNIHQLHLRNTMPRYIYIYIYKFSRYVACDKVGTVP